MDDYNTQSFIQSFIRFVCEVDCPKYILIDKDRQLVKGCDTMRLSFKYIKKDCINILWLSLMFYPLVGHSVMVNSR